MGPVSKFSFYFGFSISLRDAVGKVKESSFNLLKIVEELSALHVTSLLEMYSFSLSNMRM